jgi:hypothetical protein
MSGYVSCACRDCMEIAINDEDEPALCLECEEAGCSVDGDEECSAPHCYCSGADEVKGPDGKTYCAECGEPF